MQMTHCPKGKSYDLSAVLGEPKTRREVLQEIYRDEEAKYYFETFSEALQEELIAFCMGNRGLKITLQIYYKGN